MAQIKQSFSWWSFNRGGVDAGELLDAAVRAGYTAVDLAPESIWSAAREYGLGISAISGHGTLADGLNRRENHDRIEEEVRKKLDLAVTWNIPNLLVFSGNRAGRSDEEGAAITIDGLRRLAPFAEEAGILLVMELLNSKVDHRDYQADRTAWGVQVCEAVGSPNVKLLYDIYHMQIMEGDVIRTIQTHHAHIGHYHTAGVPGRHDLDEEQELYYPAIVRAIAATGYDGYLGHEFVPKGEPAAALAAAFRTCDV